MSKNLIIILISIVVIVGVIVLILNNSSDDVVNIPLSETGVTNQAINSATSITNFNTNSESIMSLVNNTNQPTAVNAEPQQEVINTNTATSPASNVTVLANLSGFAPATITIGIGSTVTWKNMGTKQIYIAPDNHPSHLKYPGDWDDDGAGLISPGESYSHTFNQAGTYQYHDHLKAGSRGTVIVQ